MAYADKNCQIQPRTQFEMEYYYLRSVILIEIAAILYILIKLLHLEIKLGTDCCLGLRAGGVISVAKLLQSVCGKERLSANGAKMNALDWLMAAESVRNCAWAG